MSTQRPNMVVFLYHWGWQGQNSNLQVMWIHSPCTKCHAQNSQKQMVQIDHSSTETHCACLCEYLCKIHLLANFYFPLFPTLAESALFTIPGNTRVGNPGRLNLANPVNAMYLHTSIHDPQVSVLVLNAMYLHTSMHDPQVTVLVLNAMYLHTSMHDPLWSPGDSAMIKYIRSREGKTGQNTKISIYPSSYTYILGLGNERQVRILKYPFIPPIWGSTLNSPIIWHGLIYLYYFDMDFRVLYSCQRHGIRPMRGYPDASQPLNTAVVINMQTTCNGPRWTRHGRRKLGWDEWIQTRLAHTDSNSERIWMLPNERFHHTWLHLGI